MAHVLELRAQTDTYLREERIAVVRIIALQPQHSGVDVGHQGLTRVYVGAEPAVSALGDAAIDANLRETSEQDSEHRIQAFSRGVAGRLVSGGK